MVREFFPGPFVIRHVLDAKVESSALQNHGGTFCIHMNSFTKWLGLARSFYGLELFPLGS